MGTLRVFLSYHSPDREMARRLARALAAQAPGLEVFFDCFDLRAGAFWVPALADAISNADAVIVLLGARGPGSWQRLEYFEALDRKAKDPNFPIVPVLLPNAAARLPFLYQLQQLSLADPSASNALEPLIAALYGAPAPAPEQPWRTVNPYRGLLRDDRCRCRLLLRPRAAHHRHPRAAAPRGADACPGRQLRRRQVIAGPGRSCRGASPSALARRRRS